MCRGHQASLGGFFGRIRGSNVTHVGLCGGCPSSLGLIRLLPTIFALKMTILLLKAPFYLFDFAPVLLCTLLIYVSSAVRGGDLDVKVCSVTTTFVRLVNCNANF